MIALTRAVSPTLDRCERTHIERVRIDLSRATAEHDAYERLLEELGCVVQRVPPAPELPDAVFVEDAAVVTPDVAILARPGAPSRRPEIEAVARVLEQHRPLQRLRAPATLDGGDVLRVGRRVWVGESSRTNRAGADRLRGVLQPLDYEVRPVPVSGCLHLKSAATSVAPDAVLINPARVDARAFDGLRILEVDPAEPDAANALRVGDRVVVAAAHPRTARRLEAAGIRTAPVEVSELAKAEAGVTCCSILLE